MSTVAIIPARGGSKRIPRKNLRDLGGKPLIAWTIEAATAARSVDDVVVSSECPEILFAAKEYGAGVIERPKRLAQDHVPSRDVVKHALDRLAEGGYRPDRVMLLHPTSPFRTARDIDKAASHLGHWPGAVVSFTNDELNGAIYVAETGRFLRHGSFCRLSIRPYTMDGVAGLDIDYPEDLEFAREIVAQGQAA